MDNEKRCDDTCCINNNPTMESVCDTCKEKDLSTN